MNENAENAKGYMEVKLSWYSIRVCIKTLLMLALLILAIAAVGLLIWADGRFIFNWWS